jgi:hypothetical protein
MITNLNQRRLEAGIRSAREAIDRDIIASGAIGRVQQAVLLSVSRDRERRLPWVAIAAGLVVAACLGGLVDLAVLGSRDAAPVDVVIVDPLVFGPTELDAR